ncbi:hypothetical protein DUI87_09007 [Hirundo rustica rustica]|uniref:THIF-type NAD/FAD binding fold domain-containing protein n=1 Tax=Hirundo rustica rustica TaxID=333673 RepID=A0A3M0KRF2_HIRRU|nr:hypothetical protein DUI87_09007 [Hirundo rustica rustica]
MAADSMEIDDALYSRQRYVLGDTAMQKMAQSHVFLSGIGGLGVEIAKNIILAGVKALTVHDTKHCTKWDLGINFFIHEDDVTSQRNRRELMAVDVKFACLTTQHSRRPNSPRALAAATHGRNRDTATLFDLAQ